MNAKIALGATLLLTTLDPTTLRVIKNVSLVLSILGLLLAIGWLAVRQARSRAKAWTHDFLLDVQDELKFPAESRFRWSIGRD